MTIELEWDDLRVKIFGKDPQFKVFNFSSDGSALTSAQLLLTINNVLEHLNDFDKIVSGEATLISRLVYLYKNPLRHDKGFKALRKVNSNLRLYSALNLPEKLYKIKYAIYDGKGPSSKGMEWCIACLLYYNYIIYRLHNSSTEAASYFRLRIQDVDHWNIYMVLFASVSRTWQLSIHFFKMGSLWFNNISKYLSVCKKSSQKWIPENVTLPVRIEDVLALDVSGSSVATVLERTSTESTPVDSMLKSVLQNFGAEDLGVSLNPDGTPAVKAPKKKYVPPFCTSMLFHIKSPDKVREFITRERVIRIQGRGNGLMSHLPQPKWSKFVSIIQKLLHKSTNSSNSKELNEVMKKVRKTIRYFYEESR